MFDQLVARASKAFNAPRWLVRFCLGFGVVWGVLVIGFFGTYFWYAPHYRSLHSQVKAENLVRAEFRNYSKGNFSTDVPKELEVVAGLVQELELKSSFKPQKSQCDMTLFLKSGESIQYNIYLDTGHRIAVATIQGNANWGVVGLSMGYFVDQDSRFYEWLTRTSRFSDDPKTIYYCSTLSARKYEEQNG